MASEAVELTHVHRPPLAYWFSLDVRDKENVGEYEELEIYGKRWARLKEFDPHSVAKEEGPGQYKVTWRQRNRQLRALGTATFTIESDGKDDLEEEEDEDPKPNGGGIPSYPAHQPAPPPQPSTASTGNVVPISAPRQRPAGSDPRHFDFDWKPLMQLEHLTAMLEARERARDKEREASSATMREFMVGMMNMVHAMSQQSIAQQQQSFQAILETVRASAQAEARAASAEARAEGGVDVEGLADQIEDLQRQLQSGSPPTIEPSQLERLLTVGGGLLQSFLSSDFARERWPNAAALATTVVPTAQALQGIPPGMTPAQHPPQMYNPELGSMGHEADDRFGEDPSEG